MEVARWEPDPTGARKDRGSAVVECDLPEAPAAARIADLFRLSAGNHAQLERWAETAAGDALAGTTFIVTRRYQRGR
ncbi:hypothetical protein AB0C07_38705 [Actinoplanes missouriensis]|uniref:hypothetical protein n=1 Tax=Actinoplanes missouriensis TaxID=1866 RepID=UPI00340C726E